jgi:hypothetical protein
MPLHSGLLAWIEPRDDEEVLASFVGGSALDRRPATLLCASAVEARQWIEQQAAELGVLVEWLNAPPQR